MLPDLRAAIERANAAARDVGLLAAEIERWSAGDPESTAVCARVLNLVGEFRDQLSMLRLDPLKRVRP